MFFFVILGGNLGVSCSLCEGRAVYYRSSSGHYLCISCLGRMLERSIRRYLGKFAALKPKGRVLVPVTCYNTMASLGLAYITSFIKRGYESEIRVAIPSSVYLDQYSIDTLARSTSIISVDVSPRYRFSNIVDTLRYDRVWSIRLAKILGYDTILLPITITDYTILGLEALLSGSEELLGDVVDKLTLDSVNVINALSTIEAEAIVSYAFLVGLNGYCLDDSYEKIKASRIFYSVSPKGPELEFSSVKTIDFLRGALLRKLRYTCSVCGGLSLHPDKCSSCNNNSFDKMRVEVKNNTNIYTR